MDEECGGLPGPARQGDLSRHGEADERVGVFPGAFFIFGGMLPVEDHFLNGGCMTEPVSQRSLKRVWLWALLLIVVVWVVYALRGGTSTPPGPTVADSTAQTQR
jgi:hypothetical protein